MQSTISFKLAPMSLVIRLMTFALLPIPLVFLLAGRSNPFLFPAGIFLVVIYAWTWLWFRPLVFRVEPQGLRIEWPLRSKLVPGKDIERVSRLSREQFRAEYGRGMRVGAGGLFGAFGLLVTKKATLSMYISREDELVTVHRKNGRTLLITPSQPARFVEALAQGESAR